MENENAKEYAVAFEISAIPDSSGLRIRSTSPVGIYLSSVNREAALWWFMQIILEFAIESGLLPLKQGEGLTTKKDPDWDLCIAAGTGEVTIQIVSVTDVEECLVDAEPDETLHQQMKINWWNGPNGEKTCLVLDDTNLVDSWIVEKFMEDALKNSKVSAVDN